MKPARDRTRTAASAWLSARRRSPRTWRTFNGQSMLGGMLLGQEKYAEAEPLLLKKAEEKPK